MDHGPPDPRRATGMVRRLKQLPCENRLRELGLFNDGDKRRLWGNLSAAFQYQKVAYKRKRQGLCIKACSDRSF